MTDDSQALTVEELKASFFYGLRSDLNFKFLKDLSDDDFGTFLSELLAAVSRATDGDSADEIVDVAHRWQVEAYSGHFGDPKDFPHRKDDTPLTLLNKPLSESRLLLITSSGHFVEGDDPNPLGVENMTQEEAERRVGEFIRTAPVLSPIPIDTAPEDLRVRHGGYPVQAVLRDNQVVLPLAHLRELVEVGIVGELVETAYSFVGATSQGKLRNVHVPEWAAMAKDHGADAALLIPI